MADSTEDLRREMEEFDQDSAGAETQSPTPAPDSVPTVGRKGIAPWMLWMVAFDFIVIVVVLILVFM